MNILQCQKYAEQNGFDSVEFIAHFPVGPIKCQWLDASFGLFKSDHPAFGDGFICVDDVDSAFPDLRCEVVKPTTAEAA